MKGLELHSKAESGFGEEELGTNPSDPGALRPGFVHDDAEHGSHVGEMGASRGSAPWRNL